MPSKRKQLLERAAATARRPRPERLLDSRSQKKGYRIVPVSLYTPEADWLDQTSRILKKAGNPKANRSLVVREAIYRLKDELQGKSPTEVLQYFIGQHVRRSAI